jgi:hypothetical protein
MFALVATLQRWEINPRAWLRAYLTACAESGDKVPANMSNWLPWNLTGAQRSAWRVPEAASGRDTA